MKNLKNQLGFGLIEIILVVSLITLIGFVGFRIYDANKDVTEAQVTAEKQPTEGAGSKTINNASDIEDEVKTLDNTNLETPYDAELSRELNY